MAKLQKGSNEYELDLMVDGDSRIPAITRKNINFIKGILKLDSNYKRENDNIEEDTGFDPIGNVSSSNNKYCGSMMHWFEELKASITKDEYTKGVYGAVISVDRANSTHLEACEKGRERIAESIIESYPNIDSLKQAISTPFDNVYNKHIISLISEPMKSKGENNTRRINLSFASKFCAYASMFLLNDSNLYSKYDTVVANVLPSYAKAYIKDYDGRMNFKSDSKDLVDRLALYKDYLDTIGQILKSLKDKKVTREEFDLVVWYCNK